MWLDATKVAFLDGERRDMKSFVKFKCETDARCMLLWSSWTGFWQKCRVWADRRRKENSVLERPGFICKLMAHWVSNVMCKHDIRVEEVTGAI